MVPWKRTETILSFLRLYPSIAFWTLLFSIWHHRHHILDKIPNPEKWSSAGFHQWWEVEDTLEFLPCMGTTWREPSGSVLLWFYHNQWVITFYHTVNRCLSYTLSKLFFFWFSIPTIHGNLDNVMIFFLFSLKAILLCFIKQSESSSTPPLPILSPKAFVFFFKNFLLNDNFFTELCCFLSKLNMNHP